MNLLEMYRQQTPLGWRDIIKRRLPQPSALQLATAALEQCQKDRLHYLLLADEYAAQRDMLCKRELKLKQEIQRMLEEHPQKGDGA